jgi:hypothetical protein
MVLVSFCTVLRATCYVLRREVHAAGMDALHWPTPMAAILGADYAVFFAVAFAFALVDTRQNCHSQQCPTHALAGPCSGPWRSTYDVIAASN